MQSVSIVIPVYNEAKTIVELLSRVVEQPLPFHLKKEIILVESNSTDGSRELLTNFYKSFAQTNGTTIKLLLQEKPQGKGFAVREVFKMATGDIILIQDADLEYETSDYPLVIEPIVVGHADFVLGSRHLSAGTWKIRKFESNRLKAIILNLGGIFFHTFFNIVYGVILTDPTTMYKVFRRACIEGIIFESNRFDFDYELLGKLIRVGYIPLEVPITYKSRSFSEGKKVTMFGDPLTWIRAIIKYRFCKIKRIPKNVIEKQLAETTTRTYP